MKSYFMDPYVRRARPQLALLVALPVALAVLAGFPAESAVASAVWSLVVWSGGTTLIAHAARDPGKAREPKLFALWGGKPTTRLARVRACLPLPSACLWNSQPARPCLQWPGTNASSSRPH